MELFKDMFIFNFNVTRLEWYGLSQMVNDNSSFEEIKKCQLHEDIVSQCQLWTLDDMIIQLIAVQGKQPNGYVVNENEKYDIVISYACANMDEIHIDSFSVTHKETGVSIKYEVQSDNCDFSEALLNSNECETESEEEIDYSKCEYDELFY